MLTFDFCTKLLQSRTGIIQVILPVLHAALQIKTLCWKKRRRNAAEQKNKHWSEEFFKKNPSIIKEIATKNTLEHLQRFIKTEIFPLLPAQRNNQCSFSWSVFCHLKISASFWKTDEEPSSSFLPTCLSLSCDVRLLGWECEQWGTDFSHLVLTTEKMSIKCKLFSRCFYDQYR